MTTDVTHSTTTRNTIASTVVALLNGGSIQIQTAANVVLVTLSLPATAISGSPVNGVATLASIAVANATATGTASQYVAFSSSSAEVFRGTVGTTAPVGMILDNTSIANGQPIRINACTYTAPL